MLTENRGHSISMSRQVRSPKLEKQDQTDPLRIVGESSWLSFGVTEKCAGLLELVRMAGEGTSPEARLH